MPERDAPSSDDHHHPQRLRLPLTVVVVDDDPTIRTLLARVFQADRRFTLVATAQDGQEGVEVVTAHLPDLVLLDVSMPRMDGIAAATRIHLECPGVQVVMCSSDRHRKHEAARAGAVLWIDKPINYARLSSQLLATATDGWPPPDAHED